MSHSGRREAEVALTGGGEAGSRLHGAAAAAAGAVGRAWPATAAGSASGRAAPGRGHCRRRHVMRQEGGGDGGLGVEVGHPGGGDVVVRVHVRHEPLVRMVVVRMVRVVWGRRRRRVLLLLLVVDGDGADGRRGRVAEAQQLLDGEGRPLRHCAAAVGGGGGRGDAAAQDAGRRHVNGGRASAAAAATCTAGGRRAVHGRPWATAAGIGPVIAVRDQPADVEHSRGLASLRTSLTFHFTEHWRR